MRKQLNYKVRLFLYFFVVFGIFSVVVVVFERVGDRAHRKDMMATNLSIYSELLESNLLLSDGLPTSLRVTYINSDGTVGYDRDVSNYDSMENHLSRPEVLGAISSGTSYDIRHSETTDIPYFYLARRLCNGDFIRVALPYDSNTRMLLSPDTFFLIFVCILFVFALLFLWFICARFGRNLEGLRSDLEDEVRARAQLKSEMTSAIAHELRTPVSSIRSYAETLCGEGISPEFQAQGIGRIHAASVRLSELLENVSLLTKIEEAPARFQVERIDISGILSEVIAEFSDIDGFVISNNLPDVLEMDGSGILVYSIWRNLLENALKYGDGSVSLHLDFSEGGVYRFRVRDGGGGVSDGDLGRMFERFYRIDCGRSRECGGSGLGLSIVSHAVSYHRGEVFARNIEGGVGFEVCFSLRSFSVPE